MPLYGYECACGHRLVELQDMPGKETMTCDKCGGKAVRVISPCSIRFKGIPGESGFHDVDYDAYGPKKQET